VKEDEKVFCAKKDEGCSLKSGESSLKSMNEIQINPIGEKI